MPRHAPLPPELAGGPFAVSVASKLGVGPGRLRSADLVAPFHGVRTAAFPPPDLKARCAAFATRMRPGEYFSHTTAAALHGLPLPRRFLHGPLHVTSLGAERATRVTGTVGHRINHDRVVRGTVFGLPVVSPPDALALCAPLLTLDELVMVADALMRRTRPLATMGALRDCAGRHRGGRGFRRLGAALDLARPGTDSPMETQWRLAVVRDGLPAPEVNGVILDAAGTFLAYGDLVFRAFRVLLEYDGEQHRTDDVQYYRDVDRLESLAGAGWRIVHANKTHNNDRGRAVVLERLRRALTERGWQPRPTETCRMPTAGQ
jgi:hypothetical protein